MNDLGTKVFTVGVVGGLSLALVGGELFEIYEGKAIKEHAHSHVDYQHFGASTYLVSGTTASTVALGTYAQGFSPAD